MKYRFIWIKNNRSGHPAALCLWVLSAACCGLICFSRVYHEYGVIFDFLFLMLLAAVLVLTKGFVISGKDLIYLMSMFSWFIFTLFLTHESITTAVLIIWGMVWIFCISNCSLDRRQRHCLGIPAFLALVCLVLISPGYYDSWFAANGDGFLLNPNSGGFLTAFFTSFIIVLLEDNRFFRRRHLDAVMIGIAVLVILQFESRTSLAMLLSFIMLVYLLPDRIRKSRRWMMLLVSAVILAGCVLPFFYVWLYQSGWFGGAVIFGKELFTGRDWIWNYIFEHMKMREMGWLTGIGAHGANITENQAINTHSIYLNVWMRFGIIGVMLYFGFFLRLVHNVYKKGTPDRFQMNSLMLAVSTLITGFFETTMHWHPAVFFFAIVWALPLCGQREEECGRIQRIRKRSMKCLRY